MLCFMLSLKIIVKGRFPCRRSTYKPHAITWAEVSEEAPTGKLFRMHALDREGRPVLVMRPR